jgi:NTE family protein
MLLSKRVGLALSGGGALGAAHIGVLEVLETHGVRPCCVSGTSAGSVVGAAYCAGVSVERMKREALTLQWARVGRVVRPRYGFFDGTRLEEYLISVLGGDRTFDGLSIPLACAAADLLTEEVVILREGRVALAVRASCALPGVFTPVEDYEGHFLVDGGLINNLPVAVLREMGADYVIAVDLSSAPTSGRERPLRMWEMWFLCLDTLLRNTHREVGLADAVIRPDLPNYNIFDLGNMPTYIERGRKAAEEAIPRILRDLEGG